MRTFHSLFLAIRDRLFLSLLAALFLLAAASPVVAQFKFRDPVNRQDPQSLDELDGSLLWQRFLESRSIGEFSISGILEYRPARQPSSWMSFQLDGNWREGLETTRLELSRDGQTLVHLEISERAGATSVTDLDACSPPALVDDGFYMNRVQESLPLTWSDILMPFLKWDTQQYLGPDRYLGRPAHRFALVNPDADTFPQQVVVTIDEDFAALLKADLYEVSGKAVRRIRVGGFKQFGTAWMFSELTWENRKARESMRLRVEDFSAR